MEYPPKPAVYTVRLPAPHEGYWERARLTLSAKAFRRLIADVVLGERPCVAIIEEVVEVEA